jgi:hypothetical protein
MPTSRAVPAVITPPDQGGGPPDPSAAGEGTTEAPVAIGVGAGPGVEAKVVEDGAAVGEVASVVVVGPPVAGPEGAGGAEHEVDSAAAARRPETILPAEAKARVL